MGGVGEDRWWESSFVNFFFITSFQAGFFDFCFEKITKIDPFWVMRPFAIWPTHTGREHDHRSHFAALFCCSSEDGGPLGGQRSARKQRANITQ